MNSHKISRISVFFLGIGCSYLLFVGAYPGWVSEAACPGIISFGWRANSNAIYTASTFTPQERNQIDAALISGTFIMRSFQETTAQMLFLCQARDRIR
jgi:hypothetical protein